MVTTISIVLISEKAAVLECERMIKTVETHGVTVDSIIVNHVMTGCNCDYCSYGEGRLQVAEDLSKKEWSLAF